MFHKIIVLSTGLLFLMNCSAQKDRNTLKMDTNKTGVSKAADKAREIIYFNEGENKFLKEYQMNVTFKGISEDSRCPKGVNCIWAGVAVAQVEVMGTATRPMTLSLSTLNNTERNYRQSSTFNDYTISLTDVQPYPGAAESTEALKGKYRIGITIKKGTESSTTK